MRILFITQVFYPDTVSVSQHMTDFALKLVRDGHKVTVFTSVYPYENKDLKYLDQEDFFGVKIIRLNQTSFGKTKTVFRLLDFFSFYINITFKLLFQKRNEFDIIVGSTVPPLLSFIGLLISKFKKYKYVYWVMDLQPELSISSGLIKHNSLAAKVLTKLGNYSIRNASKIVSLDHYMTKYLISRGADPKTVSTIPVWPVIDKVYKGTRLSNPFRIENKFGDRIVVMYSGNHAYVHPLDTILETALRLKEDKRFLFVFVGGGVRKKDVTNFKITNDLENIIQLPFQPRENIGNSLASADLHLVVLGNGQVGYTHPNKIYGAMFVGKPIIYIGPVHSHVTDILDNIQGNIVVSHGNVDLLVNKLKVFADLKYEKQLEIGNNNLKHAEANFIPEKLLKDMSVVVSSLEASKS